MEVLALIQSIKPRFCCHSRSTTLETDLEVIHYTTSHEGDNTCLTRQTTKPSPSL
jgi:hypothetical protein